MDSLFQAFRQWTTASENKAGKLRETGVPLPNLLALFFSPVFAPFPLSAFPHCQNAWNRLLFERKRREHVCTQAVIYRALVDDVCFQNISRALARSRSAPALCGVSARTPHCLKTSFEFVQGISHQAQITYFPFPILPIQSFEHRCKFIRRATLTHLLGPQRISPGDSHLGPYVWCRLGVHLFLTRGVAPRSLREREAGCSEKIECCL